MADHLTSETLANYRAGTLPADDLLAADDHLAGCAPCRERAREMLSVDTSAAALLETISRGRRSEHCSYETLEAYVNGRLTPIEAEPMLAHLADCRECQEDLGDLRQMRALLQVETSATPAGSSWLAFLPPLSKRRWFYAAAAAAVAGLVIWMALGSRLQDLPEEPQLAGGERQDAPVPSTEGGSPAGVAEVVTLRDGENTVVLSAQDELSGVPVVSPSVRRDIVAALRSGHVMVMATGLAGAPGALRAPGLAESFQVLEPVGRTVETARPTFRWTAHAEAESYRVAVFTTSFDEVVSSGDLSTTDWIPTTPLPRGATYVWQVAAVTPRGTVLAPAPPAPEARFAVLGEELASEIARVRREAPGSHLALAAIYARGGMRDEARRELDALVANNADSALALRLRRSLDAEPK